MSGSSLTERIGGTDTVQVVKQGKQAHDPERLRILNARGRVMREIRGLRLTDFQFLKLDPHGQPALHTTGFTRASLAENVDDLRKAVLKPT